MTNKEIINQEYIKKLIKKSGFFEDEELINIIEKSFPEIREMISVFKSFSFNFANFHDRSIDSDNLITLKELRKFNKLRENEQCLSKEEKIYLLEKNCRLKDGKIVYDKVS